MSRRLGLIIGVNQYHDTTFQPLHYAENDARALAQWLVNAKGGKWAPPDVQLVQGPHATKELVESLLSQMCLALATPDDLVFIYFAGHAFIDERSGEGYLALSNTRYQEPASAIHIASFTQHIMARSRAAHIVLIIDSYQTGTHWRMQRGSPYDFQPLLTTSLQTLTQLQGDRLFLCSCRGNEQAPETGERNLGLFMYRAIIGLCGPAIDSSTGTVSLRQLQSFLTSALPQQQQPQFFGQEHYPLILVGEAPTAHPSPPIVPTAPPTSNSFGPNTSQTVNEQILSRGGTFSATATAQKPVQAQRNTSGQLLQTSVDQRQQQYSTLLEQARHYTQQQQSEEALVVLEQALQLMPSDIRALVLKGQLLGTVGRFQEALAVIDQIMQIEPHNPLAWSMQAVVLTNIGQYQAALTAIEHSLELDANNAETYAIKNNIMETMTHTRSGSTTNREAPQPAQKHSALLSFFMGAVMQVLGFGVGSAGAILPIVLSRVPLPIAFAAEGLGLALLCVVAARSAFRYGILRLLFTLVMCIIPALGLGVMYRFFFTRILAAINDHPTLLVPFLFLAFWLAITALLPLLLGIGGFTAGLFFRSRKT